MAHFLRGKQAGVQNDLSHGISSEFFMLDDLARYGVNSQVSALAHEPVQSLLAVGTNDSQFGPGQIYIYGQRRVCVTFNLQKRASVQEIQFCGDKLVVLDSKNDVTIFNLGSRKRIATYAPPGRVTALLTDPSLDYCLTGLQNGDIVAYDLDREHMTPFRIPNLWRERDPRAKIVSIVSLQLHPKDIGSLLIGYSEGAVIYSFKQNKATKYFHYELPSGAPGGNQDARNATQARAPSLTHALWHPTGTFVLTAHEDTSLVFWDLRDGRVLEARTVEDVAVNLPSTGSAKRADALTASVSNSYAKIAWCSKDNPDDTGILLVGGQSATAVAPGLTFIDLGLTPVYQTSSWDVLTNHFRNPKRIHILPTPPNAKVTNFLLIPRSSPHFAGSHDPIAIIATLSSGELITISFPSGHPISPTNLLHVSLSTVHPFITKFAFADVDRTRWLGMKEFRERGPGFLLGGGEATKPMKRHESRNIIQTAHADGTIRVWDVGSGDQIENGSALQADLARAVSRWDNLNVAQMAMSGATGELAVGLQSGEVVVFRLNKNPNFGRPPTGGSENEAPGQMTDIRQRADPALREGLMPLTLTNDQQGVVTAMKLSNVGFLASGYEQGGITVIDLRGPAIIHTALLSSLVAKRSGSITGTIRGRKPSQSHGSTTEHPSVIEFGIMTLDGDDYSSIAMFVGTNKGRVATFKILPSQSGRFTAEFVGAVNLAEDRVVSISPIVAELGSSASATGPAMAGLQQGHKINGVLVVTTVSSAHIFRPASAKGAAKSFDNVFCDAATVTQYQQRGYALVGLFGDGCARAFSLPALKEIGSVRLNHILDIKRFSDAKINSAGDVVGWTGPSELAVASVWGAGQPLQPSADKLWDPTKTPIPRPTISNLQWIAGTQYITPSDMDVLIGGPDRPPSKRMMAEMRAQQDAEFQRQREAAKTGRQAAPDPSQESYWQYMQRQIQERTENLGLASDSMDRTAEASSTWSDDVSKFVAKQKRQAVTGYLTGKFGF
ncbi:Lethal(2) giant larvae sro7 [Lithohypha guttulata]|uniref:Lethal(2) giant larvae sro7 n=1 Tax=Lithohypha guttulata TaxID=1690604 RepID=UPI002DDE4005|nr:Lethal(2) giant larvae sro7 [Lithohypha guttulata]